MRDNDRLVLFKDDSFKLQITSTKIVHNTIPQHEPKSIQASILDPHC